MNTPHLKHQWLVTAALFCVLLLPTRAAELLVNGGFESGLSGWTKSDQVGSDGTFFLQSGNTTPVIGSIVPVPPEGSFAAMSDAPGPGSHVLYQDFVVAMGSAYTLGFSLFIGNRADAFFAPDMLGFETPTLNQQARVDIISTSADPFSVEAGDVLQNLFQTNPGDPLISGYTDYSFDVSALLSAHEGETLRLRFAEVDNVFTFNLGVDKVSLSARAASVPELLGWLPQAVSILGVLLLGSLHHRRSFAVDGPA